MGSGNIVLKLGGLHHQLAKEAGKAGKTPEAFALGLLETAVNVSPGALSKITIRAAGAVWQPSASEMVISGGITSSIRARAKAQGTHASRIARDLLAEALDEPYQQSVFDLL